MLNVECRILHYSFFTLHSSFFVLHSSLFFLHSSFFVLHSPNGDGRHEVRGVCPGGDVVLLLLSLVLSDDEPCCARARQEGDDGGADGYHEVADERFPIDVCHFSFPFLALRVRHVVVVVFLQLGKIFPPVGEVVSDVFSNHDAKIRQSESAVGTYGCLGVFRGVFS